MDYDSDPEPNEHGAASKVGKRWIVDTGKRAKFQSSEEL
jgi:hypothetical protein